MDVINDGAKGGFRRIEVLTGPARRRRWSASEKDRIVVETMEPGATVTEVARRWQVCPQQVWGWRRQARTGDLALPSEVPVPIHPTFVPIVAETPPMAAGEDPVEPSTSRMARTASAPTIEIKLAGAVVRVAVGTDGVLLTEVLRAVRASAA
jgi:transposase